jgi:hypothetical protein
MNQERVKCTLAGKQCKGLPGADALVLRTLILSGIEFRGCNSRRNMQRKGTCRRNSDFRIFMMPQVIASFALLRTNQVEPKSLNIC